MATTSRIIHGVKHALNNVVVKSAQGSYVYTECQRKLLDFSTGLGVVNLGHSHPVVVDAIARSSAQLIHAQQNIFKHRPLVDLCDKLASLDISKRSQFDAWFAWNSGSEAVEAAIKLARHATNKPNIIAFQLGYHGRTYGTMAITSSSTIYRAGFGPFMGGTFFSSFPYLTHSSSAMDGQYKQWYNSDIEKNIAQYQYWGEAPIEVARKQVEIALDSLELLLRTQSSPKETAAIILEPVLGEGGYLPSPPGLLSGLKEICQRHNILLIADEVQSGFGRTGSMFACDWIDGGVQPDILVMAKGLANGFPISAIGTRSDLSIHQPPGSMGGTYGGNAIGCAAALAVLDVFEKEKVLDIVEARHVQLVQGLYKIRSRYPSMFREIRGRGLMIGVEFERLPGKLPGATAGAIATACHERDLVILSCGPYDTLRFIPALNISSDDLQKGLEIFEEALRHLHSTK